MFMRIHDFLLAYTGFFFLCSLCAIKGTKEALSFLFICINNFIRDFISHHAWSDYLSLLT